MLCRRDSVAGMGAQPESRPALAASIPARLNRNIGAGGWDYFRPLAILPMRAGLTLHVPAIKLVQTLKRDGATLLRAEPAGDFLPRLALLALFADETGERFDATAVCRPPRLARFGCCHYGFQMSQPIHAGS